MLKHQLSCPILAVWVSGLMASSAFAEPASLPANYVVAPPQMQQHLAKNMIIDYYNSQGVWAKAYRMLQIKNIRLEPHGPHRVLAHVEYTYKPAENGLKLTEGVDKRTFLLVHQAHWRVVGMGQHMSGSF